MNFISTSLLIPMLSISIPEGTITCLNDEQHSKQNSPMNSIDGGKSKAT